MQKTQIIISKQKTRWRRSFLFFFFLIRRTTTDLHHFILLLQMRKDQRTKQGRFKQFHEQLESNSSQMWRCGRKKENNGKFIMHERERGRNKILSRPSIWSYWYLAAAISTWSTGNITFFFPIFLARLKEGNWEKPEIRFRGGIWRWNGHLSEVGMVVA